MRFYIVTLFKEMLDSYLNESILSRAIKSKKIEVFFYNPRLFVTGKYKKIWPDGNISLQVDDRPYGGGPGMVMRAEPIVKAVEKILNKINKYKNKNKKVLVVNFVPSAEKFTTTLAKNFSKKYTDIIFICGRYEGIDSRAIRIISSILPKGSVKNISIGDYVLTGGEIPAMVLVDTISRQVEGVLGNFDSREEERVSTSEVYTRPETISYPFSVKSGNKNSKKYKVPSILLSGHQRKINEWKNSKK